MKADDKTLLTESADSSSRKQVDIEWIRQLVRPDILRMAAYSSARSLVVNTNSKENLSSNHSTSQIQAEKIYLDANENSVTQSPWSRYPSQQPQALKAKLSEVFSIPADRLIVTRGSDEAIDCLIRSFVRAEKDEVISCPPTYGMYKTSTQTQGGIYTEIPLKNFDLDTEAVLSTISEKTKLIFLCSPNNPTGNLLSSEKILKLLKSTEKRCLVVVDEAYFEFSDSESWANQLENFPHLVVLRTLSKAYGLAGLRVGIAAAHQEVLQILKKVLAPYPIAACVEAEVLKSDLSGQTRALILEQKKSLIDGLSKCKVFSTIYPSHANFILCKISDQARVQSTDLVSGLRENGVIIRDRNNDFGLDNCVRITVGTAEQNNILLERISSFEKKNSIR